MTWAKGQSGNPLGRPATETTIRYLINARPMKDRKRLVNAAFRFADQGNVQWADWIMKHGGWGAYDPQATQQTLPEGSTIREIIIRETRVAGAQLTSDYAENDAELAEMLATDTPALPDGASFEAEVAERQDATTHAAGEP